MQTLSNELATVAYKIVEQHQQGVANYKIAKSVGVTTAEVAGVLKEWRDTIHDDIKSKAWAQDALATYITGLDRTIEQLNDAMRAAEGVPRDVASVAKVLNDVQRSRIEVLEKAGLLSDDEATERMLEIEDALEKMKRILREVANEYPQAGKLIRQKLAELNNEVPGEPVA